MPVDLLILGSGWTSSFLIPLCEDRGVTFAATSRSGRNATIPFTFDPESDEHRLYETLPDARTVLITFPIQTSGASQRLVTGYKSTRGGRIDNLGFIQLGATSIWDVSFNYHADDLFVDARWDVYSPHIGNSRAVCEDELLALSPEVSTTVLNLAGLWGGNRSPRNWVARVAPTKDTLRQKGTLHLIHGVDVARAILAVHDNFSHAQGQRWILTDGRVYDWWDLASAWGVRASPCKEVGENYTPFPRAISTQDNEARLRGSQPIWVKELMEEQGIRALPRNTELLGRALDGGDFWNKFGLFPVKALLEG